jgi:ATP/maltotriose-dependent transcriptional regulator MalT
LAIIGAMARVSSPAFVGRSAELDRLAQALDQVAGRAARIRLVAGEAGIGKTRLIGEFLERATRAGARSLAGECLPLGDTGLAYAPFVAALRPVLRGLEPAALDALVGPGRAELAMLLPDLRTPGPAAPATADGPLDASSVQARLFEVVLGLLRRLADDVPIVLVLEDVHWADASTRDLLRFLVRNLHDERILVIATYRSDELHRRHPLRALIAELQRLDGVEGIELAAFGAAELADQLHGILGEPAAPELVETVLARSGGNPFFAEELLAAGQAGLALPRTLRDTLEDRIRELGPDAQHAIRVASVAGSRVGHRLLAEVVDLAEDRLTEAIREVVEHHLLLPTSPDEAPGYAFRHALVREVVYEELLPTERTDLHAAYAQALGSRPELAAGDAAAVAAQVAHHWLRAHDVERALPATVAAGRAAAAGSAFAEARDFLERALELWPKVDQRSVPPDLDRITILEEAAEAAAHAGDARRSIDLIRSALSAIDATESPMRAGLLQHRLAWYLNESGDWQSGVTAFERAVSLIPIDPPTPERARVLADLAHSLMVRSRFGDSLALGEAALAISRAVGARVAEARALTVIGLDLACRSDLERGIPILAESHELATELGDPLAIFLTAVGLGWAYDETARHAEALELALATRERIRGLGADARFGGQLASKASRALYELGRWDEATTLIEETIARGTTKYAVRWLLSNRLRIRAGRGELDGARADLAMYEALGERVIGPDPDLLNARRAELAIVAGEPAVARTLIGDTLARIVEPDLDTDARMLMLLGLRAEADEAEAARAAGDGPRLTAAIESAAALEERMAAHLDRVAEVVPRPARIVDADRALATALGLRARGVYDPDAWDAAVAGRRALARPFEVAWALAGAAVEHLAARRREDGASALTEAHGIAASLGARPLRLRIESLARRARIGLEGVDTADDAAERLGLTRREREVLSLLADGRSNRQIGEQLYMAESTAGVHVSHILGKLGVTRRSEAAAVAHRMGLFGVS